MPSPLFQLHLKRAKLHLVKAHSEIQSAISLVVKDLPRKPPAVAAAAHPLRRARKCA